MPKKIQKEEDMVDVKPGVSNKPQTFVVRWFNENVVNNKSDIKIVCDLTARSVHDQFMIRTGKNTEIYAVIFYATFITILDFIREKQKRYNNFTMKIANSINVGYTNNDDDENEKVGNFMPILEYVGINRNVIDDKEDPDRTSRSLTQWQSINNKETIDFYKEIQERTCERVYKEYNIHMRISEAIIPMFCIFMDNITNVLKVKYREANGTDVSEVSMNVMGLFDIFYSFNEEENQEIIEMQPNITVKLALKSDTMANRD